MRPIDYARRLYKHIDLKTPPVDLAPALKALDISVQPVDLDGEGHGCAVHAGERPIILVERSLPFVRKRWTIAHELAHCLIPDHLGRLARNGRSSKLERQADQFATELLMPIPMVKRWWERCRRRGREKAIEQMAWDFQVSRQAMEIRLEELGII